MALNFHSKNKYISTVKAREKERESCTANKRFNEISLQIRLVLHAEL